MYFCLRVDLDYVPWDTPDAAEFGHGEPAALLRLLDMARHTGYKYHFFSSNRALRAFPANAESVLNDGHDLDWFCKHPEAAEDRFEQSIALFSMLGHVPIGMSTKNAWPVGATFDGIQEMKFLSAAPGPVPEGLTLFPVETRTLREGVRSGLSSRAWVDATKTHIREAASRNRGVTVVVRPQVLAKLDPRLNFLREVIELTQVVGLQMLTLREVLAKSR